MTITASPEDRLGEHVVLTITAPTYWVVLEHHGREVKVDVLRLIEFDRRYGTDPEEWRYDPLTHGWNWREEVALRDAGWLVVLSSGGFWPSPALHSVVAEWKRKKAMG